MSVPSQVVELVQRFHRNLDLYKRQSYKEARVRVEFIDRQIDALVYELYGLTEQEIRIVEEATRQGAVIASDTVTFLAAHQGRPLKLLLAILGV